MSLSVAFNKAKNAYLFMDKTNRWSLTTAPSCAYAADADKLRTIVTTQLKASLASDWTFVEVKPAPAAPAVQGKWKATDTYNEILEAVQHFTAVVSKSHAVELASKVTQYNAEVVDLEHYIELHDLTEQQELEAIRTLRTTLRNRRNVKQELDLLNRILDCGVRQMTDGHTVPAPVDTVPKAYTPRSDGSVFRHE